LAYLSLIPFALSHKLKGVIEWTIKKEMSLETKVVIPYFWETVSTMMPIRKLYFTPKINETINFTEGTVTITNSTRDYYNRATTTYS
jgi:hypothetical protein